MKMGDLRLYMDDFARDEVEAMNVFGCLSVRNDDTVGLLEGEPQTVMEEMTSQPAIAMSVIGQESEFFGFHHCLAFFVFVFLHRFNM